MFQFPFQPNAEAIPFATTVLIAGWLSVLAWHRRRLGSIAVATAFAAMMAGEVVWALFEAVELVVDSEPIQRACFALRAAGASITMLGLLAFVLGYTGHDRWLAPRRFTAIAAPSVVLTLLAWTNSWHHLYWRSIESASIDGHRFAVATHGPAFSAHLTVCYAMAAASALLLVFALIRSAGIFRVQAAIMLLGLLVPWVVNALELFDVFGFVHVDTVALAFGVTGLAFFPALGRYRLLDLRPVAWETVVRRMDDAVAVLDRRARILELNPAAERFLSLPRARALGEPVARALARWPALADRLDPIQGPIELTIDLSTATDGESPAMTCEIRLSPLVGHPAEGGGWLLVVHDITARRRSEADQARALREHAARAEAEAANREKDRFLATLSHEFRTPLSPILATVAVILERPETPESIRPALEMIRRNVNLEVRLIDDLLDLTRVRGGKLHLKRELVDAHELIHRVAEICRDDLNQAGLALILELSARRHDVHADPIRLQQVFWNLVKNAIKFTPAGGIITIRTREGGPAIALNCEHVPGRLVIEVIDTGIGIEPATLPRIFQMFEQGGNEAARRSGGLGLGLTISRSIVERHGGDLSAASDGPGHGTTFTVELPTASAPPRGGVPTIEPMDETRKVPRRTLRILLVDDNADTRSALSELLTRRGHEVQVADGVASATLLAASNHFDLLISDIELTDGTGLQLLQSIRSDRPIAAIALSGLGSSDDLEMSRSAGFAMHLMKPIDLPTLEAAIDRLAHTQFDIAESLLAD